MTYSTNSNLEMAVGRAVSIFEGFFIYGALIFFSTFIALLLLGFSGVDFWVITGIAVAASLGVCILPAIVKADRISRIISQLDIKDSLIFLDTTSFNLSWGLIEFSQKQVGFTLAEAKGKTIPNNLIPMSYKTEIYCISYGKRYYYLIEAFFDEYKEIKNTLLKAGNQ